MIQIYMTDLNDFINSWLKHLKSSRNLSDNTVNSYRSDITQLISFLRNYKGLEINIEEFKKLTRSDIRAWFLNRRNNNETPRTISRGLSATKSFFKFLIKEQIISGTDIVSIKPPKTEKSLPRPLNISQINGLIDSISDIKQTEWIVQRDKALLALIYSVGLRLSEALSLNRSDILDSQGAISVLGKGGKIRRVPLIESIHNVILDYLKSCKFNSTEALFVNNRGKRLTASSVQKLIKRSRQLLALSNNVTPHSLRHSCATHLMENSGNLRGIQELLGHSSISSTQIYADVAKKYIAEIYDKCHPLSRKNSVKSKT